MIPPHKCEKCPAKFPIQGTTEHHYCDVYDNYVSSTQPVKCAARMYIKDKEEPP